MEDDFLQDNVIYLADHLIAADRGPWSMKDALQAAAESVEKNPENFTGVLVITVNAVPGKLYATGFYQSGMTALEMAQLCRVMELRFMNMLGTVKTEIRETAVELMDEEGILG